MPKFINTNIQGLETFADYLNAIYLTGKRSMKEQAFTHFKGVVRNVYAITFPMGGKKKSGAFKFNKDGERTGAVDFPGGKKAGQVVIARDVNNAFMTPKEAQAALSGDRLAYFYTVFGKYKNESPEATLAYYLQRQNKHKHPKPGRRPVKAGNKMFVYRELVKRQGFVASGWNKAATYFGISIPSWISKWGTSNGSLSVQDQQNTYRLQAVCSTQHPNATEIQEGVDIAMNMQKQNMKRILLDLFKKQNKRRGLITR